MPRVMVVAESENFQAFAVAHQRFENLDPMLQIASTVDDGLVPRRGLLLNLFAVSKPANVSEVRRNQIELLFHLPRSRHERCVSQCQCDIVLPEHVRESGIEPLLVSNLDYKFVIGRKPLQKGCEHGEKNVLVREFATVEQRQ